MTDISVAELKAKRDAHDDFILLDVREPDEIDTASIDGALAIPMGELAQRFGELPKDKPIVVMCHGGGRSARATQFLNTNGYDNAVNLAGGIDAWAERIDPTVPRY